MEQPKRIEFTADEFIPWALQPTGRFEFENGVVVAMAPEHVNHRRAKRNATIALHNAIGAQGLACEVLPDGASVRVGDQSVYEPDALVRSGPPLPGDAIETDDPVVIVEVVSPSSRGIDRGVKLAGYFLLPSLRHYLIVDTHKRVVLHHRRGEDGRIDVQVLHDDPLVLDPPGLTIETVDIFSGL